MEPFQMEKYWKFRLGRWLNQIYVSDINKSEVYNIFDAKYFLLLHLNTQRHKYTIPRLISQITVNTVAQWCFQNIAVCFKIQARLTQQHHPNQWPDNGVELPVCLANGKWWPCSCLKTKKYFCNTVQHLNYTFHL